MTYKLSDEKLPRIMTIKLAGDAEEGDYFEIVHKDDVIAQYVYAKDDFSVAEKLKWKATFFIREWQRK